MKDFLTDDEMSALSSAEAPDFIPDDQMATLNAKAPAKEASPSISALESAARGLAQGATFGFSDEVAGGIDWLLSKTGNLLVPDGSSNPYAEDEGGEVYRRGRDEERSRNAEARKANPKAYIGGELAGSAATLAIPGLGAAKGATTAAVAGRAAAAGTISGLGLSDEEELSDLALDAAFGGALGGALGAAGDKVGKAIRGAPDALKGAANTRTQKALGFTKASLKQARRVSKELPDEAAEFALANKMITPGSTAEDIAAKNTALKEAAGEAIGRVYKALDGREIRTFNPADVAERLTVEISQPLAGKETSKASFKFINSVIKDITSYGDEAVPFETAAEIKKFLQDQIRRTGGFNPASPTEKNTVLRDALKVVTAEIDGAVERGARLSGNPKMLARLQSARKAYGITKTIDRVLEDRLTQTGNKLFGLTDTIMAGGAMATNPLAVVPVVLAKKLGEKYGNNVSALAADRVSNLLKNNQRYFKIFEKVAPRGAPAIMLTHEWLSNNDPEYKKATAED